MTLASAGSVQAAALYANAVGQEIMSWGAQTPVGLSNGIAAATCVSFEKQTNKQTVLPSDESVCLDNDRYGNCSFK